MIDGCEQYDGLLMRVASLGFAHGPRYGASLVMRRPVSSGSSVGGKNGVRHLRPSALGVLRPQGPLDSGPAVWRHPRLPGGGHPPGVLPNLSECETGAAHMAGPQPVVHEAVCVLCRAALPGFAHSVGIFIVQQLNASWPPLQHRGRYPTLYPFASRHTPYARLKL